MSAPFTPDTANAKSLDTERLERLFEQAAAQTRFNQAENRARELAAGYEAGTHCSGCDGVTIYGWCPSCAPTPDVSDIAPLRAITTTARQIDPAAWGMGK
jgi:hypothetical protein